MQQLVIDYVLDGEQRGYNFVTPTRSISTADRKTIWRQAMPRGQGWGDSLYADARAIKCIPLSHGQVAISEVRVTGQRDEIGRQGLRRAEISVLDGDEYEAFMTARWQEYPPDIREAANSKLGLGLWARLTDAAMPKVKGEAQIILAHRYSGAAGWQVVEAVIFKIALAKRVRWFKGWGRINPFTTLVLDHREESRLIAMPLEVAWQIKPGHGVTVIDLD